MKIGILGISITAVTMLVLLFVLFGLSNAALADEGVSHEHEHGFDFSLFSFVKPLGICALSLVLITFCTGLFRRKLGRRFLKVHKVCAFSTVVLALSHGILVLSLF